VLAIDDDLESLLDYRRSSRRRRSSIRFARVRHATPRWDLVGAAIAIRPLDLCGRPEDAAYNNFLMLWKRADRDMRIPRQAKAKYAKLR
jgi:hypothetical protein